MKLPRCVGVTQSNEGVFSLAPVDAYGDIGGSDLVAGIYVLVQCTTESPDGQPIHHALADYLRQLV